MTMAFEMVFGPVISIATEENFQANVYLKEGRSFYLF